MNSAQQAIRDLRGRPQAKARRAAHSVELLEARFLLSSLVPGTTDNPPPLLPLPVEVASLLPDGPYPYQATVNLSLGSSTVRDDSYTLGADAADGLPGVQVDLIWPVGLDAEAGHLQVSDASGNLLYDVPLLGIAAIDGQFPIPLGQGNWPILDVNLQVTRPGPDPASTGSYAISISWDQPALTVAVNAPSLSVGTGSPSIIQSSTPSSGVTVAIGMASETTPTSPRPSLTATMPLPTPFATTATPDTGNLSASFGANSPITAQSAPGLSGVVAVPVAPGSTSTSTAPASTSTSTPGAGQVPLAPASASASGSPSAIAAENRPAVVGPLPLSGSSPDGGIFAYPYSQAKGQVDPFRATFTIAPVPDRLDAPGDMAGAPSRRRSARYPAPIPFDVREFEFSIVRPFDLGLAGTPAATGVAFLPPIAHLAVVRVDRDPDRDQSQPSRWPVLHGRSRPRISLGSVLLGSVGLFFGLAAPDCLTMLATWQDDRRWKRQFATGDPKR